MKHFNACETVCLTWRKKKIPGRGKVHFFAQKEIGEFKTRGAGHFQGRRRAEPSPRQGKKSSILRKRGRGIRGKGGIPGPCAHHRGKRCFYLVGEKNDRRMFCQKGGLLSLYLLAQREMEKLRKKVRPGPGGKNPQLPSLCARRTKREDNTPHPNKGKS